MWAGISQRTLVHLSTKHYLTHSSVTRVQLRNLSCLFMVSTELFYYIKISCTCTLSGSKLIKTLSHLLGYHCDIICENIFVPLTTLKFVGVWSQQLWIFCRLQQSLVILGILHKMFGNAWKMLGNVFFALLTYKISSWALKEKFHTPYIPIYDSLYIIFINIDRPCRLVPLTHRVLHQNYYSMHVTQ